MKKIFTILVLAMASVMSWAASIGAPASIDFGTYNIYGKEELTDGVELVLNPVGISGGGIYVEVKNDPEGVFYTDHTWLYANGHSDFHGQEYTSVHFYAIEAGAYTATLLLGEADSYDWETDTYGVYQEVPLKVTIVNNAPVSTTFVKVNATSELKDGDEVIFVSESANAVCGPLNGTYLPAVTEGVTIADSKVTFPEAAQTFIANKFSGDWQFTTADTGKRLHLDASGKGAFTYADTLAGTILANWGVSVSSGVATISKPDGTFPVWFNADRFKPYKNGSYSDVALYKKEQSAQGIEDVTDGAKAHKVLRDGQIVIIRNGETYSITGVKVE